MNIIKKILFSLLFIPYIYSQAGSLVCTVFDSETGKPLSNVNFIFTNEQYSAAGNSNGRLKIENLPAGNYSVLVSHIGYESKRINFTIASETIAEFDIQLTSTPVTLGEVTVTGTRYIKTIKDVSMPMEVAWLEKIESSPAVTPADLLKTEPGVSIERDGIWATSVNIRGLSRENVVTLIDGNRIETATDLSAGLSLIDLEDIERIEVIKGAASSLYGTGALGGVINFISKGTGFSDKFFLTGALSSAYNTVNEGTTNNLSLKAGSSFWYLRLNGTIRNAGNTQTPEGELQNSQFSDNNISGELGVRFSTDQELKINYQRFYAEDVGIPGGSTLFPSNAEVRYPTEKRDLFSAEYSVRNLFKPMTKLSVKYFNQNIYRDVENIPHIVQNMPQKKISVEKITPNARHYINGIQLQTNWLIGESNLVIAGIDAWQRRLDSRRERHLKIETLDSTGENVVNTTYQVIGERPLPESDYRSIGFYMQDEIKVIEDKLTLTLGGRIDRIDISNQQVSNPVYQIVNGVRNDSPPSSTLYWDERDENDLSWSGNLGILYSLNKNTDFTFTGARSFRSPSLEERYQYIDLGSVIRLGNPDLEPENGWFIDAGIRFWYPTFSFKGNLFINLLNNLVVEKSGTYDGRPALIKSNVGKAMLYGFDLGFEFNFYHNTTLYGNLAYVRGEDTENEEPLPQVPPLNGLLGIRSKVMDYLNINIQATLFAEQNKVAEGELETPGYAYFDFFVNTSALDIGIAKLRFFAGVENIFDKAYRNHLSTNRGLVTIEPGRNIFVKASINW